MDESTDVPSMKILENDEEFEKLLKKRFELSAELVDVKLQGLDLPENSVTRLESQIKDIIKEKNGI